ncbi:histidinol-phosphatase [Pseudomonas knackmussii]|uniref:histidinol-phosphatase n=1 Tax=Pseudomonas knackmussii TaxID=65741 RepID=UPI003F4A1768
MSFSERDLAEYLAFAHELADAAGAEILPYFRAGYELEDKGTSAFDPVTSADRAAESVMRKLITHRYPTHGVLGEEEGSQVGDSREYWVLDPIDGTRAFITGIPLWGVLVALNDGDHPRLGIVDQPFMGERFVGDGNGAWLNGRPIRSRRCGQLGLASIMCTSPDNFISTDQRQRFHAVTDQARMLRYGGDCYSFCMVALGQVDAVIEPALKPYDIQALIPIIEGAGGVVTTWSGGDAQHGGSVVVSGDPQLHEQILALLAEKPCASGGVK